ncbi:cadherin-like beta sandwich domain-containing protein [Nitrospira sp. BLG_1]|uniref:cadherin-like beta sandwich domain-containing protein n=1 Tax=Nitrospira sp. BLG_1 TaxID=3395883 RepID=UPI0039BC6980
MKHLFTMPAQYLALALLVGTIGFGTAGCTDTGSIDPGPQLAGLSVSGASLQPPFTSDTTDYTVDLSGTQQDVTISATKSEPNDVLSGGITAPAGQVTGQATVQAPGPGSTKDVSLTVSSSDGRAKIYTITLRAITLAGDNTLKSLTVSPGTLAPVFSAATQNYTVNVANTVTEVTVVATKSDPNAVISGDGPNEGRATLTLDGPGTTKVVSLTVTAPNGTSRSYTIAVTRARPSSDDALADLTVTPGSLDPAFSSDTVSYRVTVASDVERVTISATKSDPNAVLSALGSIIAAAGTQTGQISVPLTGRRTEMDLTVTAQDGATTRSYAIFIRSRR